MKKIFFLLTILYSLLYAKTYTVDELVIEALKNSPDINISTLDYEASQKRYDQAFGNYLPRLDIGASYSHIDSKTAPLNIKGEDEILSGSLTLQQLIYDFGKSSGRVGNTKELTKVYDATLQERILTKKRDVKLAYYIILTNKALITVNEESLKLNQAQLYRSKRYYEAGIRTKIDISDAQVRVVKAEIALKNSHYDLEKSFAKLDTIVGFTQIGYNYDVFEKKLDMTKSLYEALPLYPYTMQESIRYAYEHRPKLQGYRYKISAQQELQKSISSAYYPSLYLKADYLKSDSKDYSVLFDQDKWSAGAYLQWNLFSGGSDKAKIEEQQLLTQKSSADLTKAKLDIKEEVTRAYISLKKSREDVKLSESLLHFSAQKFDQVTKQYEHGLSDYIELQEARQGYIDAKSNLIISYYNYYASMAVLDAAIGR